MNMPTKKMLALALIFAATLLAACGENNNTAVKPGAADSADPVLARVGETEIRRSQLDVLIGRLNDPVAAQLTPELEQKMLQSLVRARALALVAEQNMDAEEKIALEARVQAFRDELLAQHYLQNNVVAQPVTAAQVAQYYRTHIDDYTTAGEVSYQYLASTETKLEEGARKQLLTALGNAKDQEDWRAYAARLQKQKLPVEFKAANLVPELIAEPLRGNVQNLEAGQTSGVIVGEHLYIARVLKRRDPVVRPLHDVSAEIRKKLAPMQLKQALAESAKQVLATTKVEIVE